MDGYFERKVKNFIAPKHLSLLNLLSSQLFLLNDITFSSFSIKKKQPKTFIILSFGTKTFEILQLLFEMKYGKNISNMYSSLEEET